MSSAGLPHQLSQLCNSQHNPLLALQQNFSHLLTPNYVEQATQHFTANQQPQHLQQQQLQLNQQLDPTQLLHNHHHNHRNLNQQQQPPPQQQQQQQRFHHLHHHHHHTHNHHEHNNSTHHLRNHQNWRKSKSQTYSKCVSNAPIGTPHSLLNLSAKVVAEHVPFQLIEQRYEHIPEPVQRRIIFWSFPRHEDDIKMYSSLSSDTFNGNGPSSSSNATSTTITATTNTQSTASNNAFANWIDHSASTTQQNSGTISNVKNSQQHKQLTFHKGLRLYNEGCVQDVLQVGFNLSGIISIKTVTSHPLTSTNSRIRGNNHSNNNNNVNNNNNNIALNVQNNNNNDILNNQNQAPSLGSIANDSNGAANSDSLSTKNYRVSVTFDRCKITSVSCSCDLQDIFWCEHVVALVLYRIRNPETIDLRVPISETLLSLDRQQLQKLVQYIIAEHHTEVLPTAQRLLDEMRQSLSEINQIQGAPDPTAGASADDHHIWHLDEYQVNEKVQNYLNLVCNNSKDASKHINALFEKIREMFRAKDSNGTRLLKLMTEQFLLFATRNEKSRSLWDQLVSLWVVVMVNPDLPRSSKNSFIQLLMNWSKVPKCPKEDIERKNFVKRKASEMSDDEQSNDYVSNSYSGDYQIPFNQGNNYPAHMATHRHRVFQQSTGFPPVLRPFNQLPNMSSACASCLSNPLAKKMKTLHMQQPTYELFNPFTHRPQRTNPTGSSSSQQNLPRSLPSSSSSNENRVAAVPQEPRSVFYRALDFQSCTWDDPHLQLILNKDGPVDLDTPHKSSLFDYTGYPLWNEPISQAAARVETLRSHGYRDQALRLTVATVRRLKLLQEQWFVASNSDSAIEVPCFSKAMQNYSEGWIGHPFDPVNVLMDILLEASVNESNSISSNNFPTSSLCNLGASRCCPYNQALADFTQFAAQHRLEGFPMLPLVNLTAKRVSSSVSHNADKTPYYHVPVPGCCQKDTYLTLAVEVALIALGQQRSIPPVATAYDRSVRQESELIGKLESIDTTDPTLIERLKYQSDLLLKGGPFQNSCCGNLTDSTPLHTYARYLFDSLVNHYPQLAYNVGVYALKKPLLSDDNSENFAASRTSPRTINHNHLQAEQLLLAQTMLSKAKDEGQQVNCPSLRRVYKASVKNIRNPASLLKLSKHVLKEAKQPSGTTIYPALLRTSFDLGLEVLKMTLSPQQSHGKTRREAISFIVECATDNGLDAVLQVMREAKHYFSPKEALNLVVPKDNDSIDIRSQVSAKMKLKEDSIREMELINRSRDLVLECAALDPANCALEGVKFCCESSVKTVPTHINSAENNHPLKRALEIVVQAGTLKKMDSSQLIKIADYIHEVGMTNKAFDIALVAVDTLTIPSNSDNSSSKKDIESACQYAQKVNGFSTLIPKLISNIECATTLSDIYQQFYPHTTSYRNYANELMNTYTFDILSLKYNQTPDDSRWWDALLAHTLSAFKETTKTRLLNISPRHYGEFIEFLGKAEATFQKAAGGHQQFKELISTIIKEYKTKKKLIEKLKIRFDYSIKTGL